jgi:hypothetical protein
VGVPCGGQPPPPFFIHSNIVDTPAGRPFAGKLTVCEVDKIRLPINHFHTIWEGGRTHVEEREEGV